MLPAAGQAALFPAEVPAKQDESDTPVGVLARLWVPPYIGKPKTHGAAGWGQHSHLCADATKGGRGGAAVPGHPSRAGWARGTRGAAAGVAPRVTAWGMVARQVAKGDGLNVGDSDGVIRGERRKWRDVLVRQTEHCQPRQEGAAANTHSSPGSHQNRPTGDPKQPQLSPKAAPLVTQISSTGDPKQPR